MGIVTEGLRPLFDDLTQSPVIIAGPCSAESEKQVLEAAAAIAGCGVGIFRAGVWKPRTKPGGFEGIGSTALRWLAKVKTETGMRVATEVATPSHLAEAVDAGVDLVWVGARTSANPFAVQQLADAFAALPTEVLDRIAVLVKNPVNPDLELWIGALERIRRAGVTRLGAIHRGFSSYGSNLYRNPPKWAIPIELRRRLPGLPVLCDPSHIGGRRDLVPSLSQQAMDMDFDGLIIESHCHPDEALSDAAQQLTPAALGQLLSSLVKPASADVSEELCSLRRQIDSLDDELLELLARRMQVAREIGRFKRTANMPVVQPERYNDLMHRRVESGVGLGMSYDFVSSVLSAIHEESVRQQVELSAPDKA